MFVANSSELPRDLYGSLEAKKIDEVASVFYGLSSDELMQRAGRAALAFIQTHWPTVKSLAIICGTGNNGGDGFALAYFAKAKGYDVTIYQVGNVNENNYPIAAKNARQIWLKEGEILTFNQPLFQSDLIVDAILGIGAKGSLSLEIQHAIAHINESKKAVFALDIPSGLNADTGATLGQCIQAQATLTFIVMKLGLLSYHGISHSGKLAFASLDVDLEDLAAANVDVNITPIAKRLVYENEIDTLPKRCPLSHKGNHGHVVVIGGGEPSLCGAVILAGTAALRAGAGLVSAIVAPPSFPLLAKSPPELMCQALKNPKDLLPMLTRSNVIVLGNGLGKTKWSKRFFHTVMKSSKFKIIDADGLYWLSKFPQKHENWILTPHPKEAAYLLGISTEMVEQDRLATVYKLKEKYGGVIVLKGAGSLILSSENVCFLNQGGYPALAVGGTGDVLAGLIGGLLAQGMTLSQSAALGVIVHTEAAKSAQIEGERGMFASDLFAPLRKLLNPTLHSNINTRKKSDPL